MIDVLKKIIPAPLQGKLYAFITSLVKEKNRAISSRIPRHAIKAETIAHTKLLLNRGELLKRLPKQAVVAELGVDQGYFSEWIWEICEPSKLVLVDLWGSERFHQGKRKAVEDKFNTQINAGKVQIEIGLSTEVGERFPDHYFDWIYIDTDHLYQTTIKELEIWAPKVKEGGIIAGHDYIIGNWDGMVRYGVIEAVYEFCSKYQWEILYLTMEHDSNPSFALRKI